MFILRHFHEDQLVSERGFDNDQQGPAAKAMLELQKTHSRLEGNVVRLDNEPDADISDEDRARLLAAG